MRIRVQVVIESGGSTPITSEIAQIERSELTAGTLGLHLAEGKSILARLQRSVVDAQVAEYVGARSRCPTCHAPLRCKGHHEIVYRTVFGKQTLNSPRLYDCNHGAREEPDSPAVLTRSCNTCKPSSPHSCRMA